MVSVSFMLSAVAIACLLGGICKSMISYLVANSIAYVIITIIGVSKPSKFLLLFEMLMLFALPGILIILIITGISYVISKNALDGSLIVAAVFLILVNVAYFSYFATGITAQFYQGGKGFYFSENTFFPR